MAKPAQFLVGEIRHMLPPTIFFLVSFNLIVLTVALLSEGGGASLASHAGASVAALLCGKAVLIADKLPFFNRYPDRPLAWNVAWKAGLYVLVTLLFRLLEAVLSAATGDYGLAGGLEREAAEFSWARFAAIQLWLVILFVAYTAFGELVGQIGRARMLAMFFGPMPEPSAARAV